MEVKNKKQKSELTREEKHLKNKNIFKGLGITCLVIGLGCVIAGFVDFFTHIGGWDPPKLFWLFFIGFPFVAAGLSMTMMGFKKELGSYIANESVPVINQASGDLTPTFKNIKTAFSGNSENIICSCGFANGKDEKFCGECGKKLSNVCAKCHTANTANRKYCKECGELLIKAE